MAMNFSNISNISSNDNSEIGGSLFFLTYISEYLPYVTLVSIGAVIGVIGNLIILLTIITNKELHSPTYMLMFNLSIADILISGFVDSTSIWSVFMGKTYFENRPSLCIFIGIVCFLGYNTSLVNLGFIAINRYINICHNGLYKKLFTNKLTLLYCLLAWILGFLNSLPNITGWGNYSYDEATLSCVWNRLASISYNLFLSILSVIIPCVVILLFYVRIFYYSYKSGQRSNSSSDKKSIRLAKGLFASFMLYTICWMPYGLVVLIDFYEQFPKTVMMFTMTFGHLNSSLNPIIYFYFNSTFRRGCLNLFSKVFFFAPFCKISNNKVSSNGNAPSANNLVKIQNRTLLY